MTAPAAHRLTSRRLAGLATVVAASGAVAAARGHLAAGVALVALALAVACTALRHHLNREPRR